MTLAHAVVWTDHHSASVVQFDDDQVLTKAVHEHVHETGQHKSDVRSEHEFFGAVCDACDGIAKILVTGSKMAVADFRHYVDKHRPQVAPRIIGYDVVDHPSEKQLVALARTAFERAARMG